MQCPKCQDELPMVVDSRKKPYGVYRRRECLVCGHRYSTVEIDVKRYKLLQCVEDFVLDIAEELSNCSKEEN